ncbi:replication initiation protein [Corynebacterium sp. ES2715-CONJ3]|uniref:replication initiation protein n=1 Tax=Corynebacterium sp. ES2715-CONJ3 TaxID=2974028 RepID=UPI0021699A6D|nr:replication initiation protein [Corynebacterium sp. ES2715-CONJ3]MCS4492589.1 replication initiation protein [Corynebacterium sp. ES2715-CONJ3]
MSLANETQYRTLTRVCVSSDECAGLFDTPASTLDRDALAAHIGASVLHGSVNRDFAKSYNHITDPTGAIIQKPRYYRVDSPAFAKCEYAVLTTRQKATVMVIDVDQPGTPGGHPSNLAPAVKEKLAALVEARIEPAWVGINPQSGKAQLIWLIDPVYADKGGKSRHMDLLAAASRTLGELLDHDPHFAHRFSRNPFYTGKSPTAYRWYCQHKRVIRLGDFIKQVRDMAGLPQHEKTPRQQFSSGRELINAVKARREQAEAFKALAQDVESELGDSLDRYDPELIDGVRVLWIVPPTTNANGEHVPGTAARDETAFRHALKTGHRLRQAGKRLKDTLIIDAYTQAYLIAHEVGGAMRPNELPKQRDLITMARRVRGYVTTSTSPVYTSQGAAEKASSSERKALATMGRRGGKTAAKRWEDPNSEYAQDLRKKLAVANKRRAVQGQTTRARVQAIVGQTFVETGKLPSRKELMAETGLSEATVKRHLRALRASGLIPE